LGGFEKYLILWIPLCMVAGVLLAEYTNIGDCIEALAIRESRSPSASSS
jgi:ACR3 family arsenite efflux pump ArsB